MTIIIGQTDYRCKNGINFKKYEVNNLQEGKKLYKSIPKAIGNCFSVIINEYPLIEKCDVKVINLKDIMEE